MNIATVLNQQSPRRSRGPAKEESEVGEGMVEPWRLSNVSISMHLRQYTYNHIAIPLHYITFHFNFITYMYYHILKMKLYIYLIDYNRSNSIPIYLRILFGCSINHVSLRATFQVTLVERVRVFVGVCFLVSFMY